MSNHYDIIIIGAGPAGMAAAQMAASYGARTLVLDEQPDPGGDATFERMGYGIDYSFPESEKREKEKRHA